MPFPRHVHITFRSSSLSLSPPLTTTTLKPPTPISYTLRNHTTRTGPRTHERPPSSAQPASPSTPSTSSTSTTLTDTVNAPPSTLPADLVLPDPINPSAPTTQKLIRLITVGRAYLSFYKTGLKNVYHNYRASIPFRRELGLSVYIPTSPSPSSVRGSSPSKTNTLQLSRSNFQLLHRSSHDLRRLIPFSITLLICGELTPILVLLLGNAITPTTCRIPRQITKSRIQRSRLKKDALVAEAVARNGSLVPVAPGSDEELDILGRFVELGRGRDGDGNGVVRACAVFGLAKRVDVKGPLAWVMGRVYRRRLRGYVEYLGLDDELIREGGGVTRMEGSEVRIAVEERGGDIGGGEGKDEWEEEREERRWLERWLQRRLG